MNRLLISAAHKSSGKTMLTLGLCAALRKRGLVVQPFKKGPDYIDPKWLSLASRRDCHNLDFYLMGRDEILNTFTVHSRNTDISLIEGNKGLYDGLDLDGSNSNAALARLLETPIVLVIDARGMTRGIAPLILGYQAFDPKIRIAGVILNQLGGSRHEAKLRAVIEHYTEVPVIGALQHDDRLSIIERHLGLIPSNETGHASQKIDTIADLVAEHVDVDRLLNIAASATPLAQSTLAPIPLPDAKAASTNTLTPTPLDSGSGLRPTSSIPGVVPEGEGVPVRIGIARDAAFSFYYPGDLEALGNAGAELVPFNTLLDPHLPAVDALFIGGGFPEVHMDALQANATLRRDIHQAIQSGMPVYAECGGLMYLSRSLSWHGQRREMVGAIPADAVMHSRPMGRGYVLLRETGKGLWPLSNTDNKPAEVRAHEFHYSSLKNLDPSLEFAYDVLRGNGIDGRNDGIVYKNVLACYAHMRDLANNRWAERFIDFVRHHKKRVASYKFRNKGTA